MPTTNAAAARPSTHRAAVAAIDVLAVCPSGPASAFGGVFTTGPIQ